MIRRIVVRRVDEILIQVSDINRSLKFYREGLGIPLEPTCYGDDSFEAKVGQTRVLLHPDFDDSLKKMKRGAGIMIHFWVPDVDKYCREIRKRGVVILEEPEDRPWGRHLSVVDPDRYRVEILGPVRQGRRIRHQKLG